MAKAWAGVMAGTDPGPYGYLAGLASQSKRTYALPCIVLVFLDHLHAL